MALEVTADTAICSRCGTKYGRRKGYFPVSYAQLHKGIGYVPVCKKCIDKMYDEYLAESKDSKLAVRRVCRKLDLYWDESLYNLVIKKNSPRTIMTQYIAKLNTNKYAGKSYDDTLSKEGTLWSTPLTLSTASKLGDNNAVIGTKNDDVEVTEEMVSAWGFGLSPLKYKQLELRKKYWIKHYEEAGIDIDVGAEALIRQICALEIDINEARAVGVSAGEITKMINTLNTLLGSANVKPVQNKTDSDTAAEKTPMGVWIQRWEKQRPVPEPDPELQDVDGITKYILTWVYGHLAKMLGIKNNRCKLYEKAINELRVKAPEYDGEDDDSMLYDIFESEGSEDN